MILPLANRGEKTQQQDKFLFVTTSSRSKYHTICHKFFMMPSNILHSQINMGHAEIQRSGQLSQEISQINGLFTQEDPKECSCTAYRHKGMFPELW